MIRALLAGLLLACSVSAAAQNWTANPVDKWGGLNVFLDASKVDDADSPDAANVLTDGAALEKRPGNVRIAQILNGFAAAYVREWIAPSQTKYLIAHSSTTVYQTDLGSAVTALSTVTASANLDSAPAFGKIFFQDGTANPWYWDGTSTATQTGMPIGRLIEFADERIYVANIPSESGSRVRVSSFGSVNYFTVPSNVSTVGDAPNVFDFQRDDGENITCFKATPWGKVVGKRHSMHILKGYDNLTYYKRLIDPNIGCIDDRSMQMVDGLLIWLSFDGIYGWTGTGAPLLLSKDVEPLVKAIRQINSQLASWVVDTQGDWNTGTFNANGSVGAWSATTSSGSLVPISFSFVDTSSTDFAGGTLTRTATDYTDNVRLYLATRTVLGGDFNPATSWSATTVNDNAAIGTTEISLSTTSTYCPGTDGKCAVFVFHCTGASCTSGACPQTGFLELDAYNASETFLTGTSPDPFPTATCSSTPCEATDSGTHTIPIVALTTHTIKIALTNKISTPFFATNAKSSVTGNGFTAQVDYRRFCRKGWVSGDVMTYGFYFDDVRVSSYPATGSFTSRTFDTRFETPTFNLPVVTISSNVISTMTLQEQRSGDGVSWDTAQTFTQGSQPSQKKRYWRYIANFETSRGTMTAVLHEWGTTIAIGTGTYNSDVHFIGTQISTFSTFNATETQDGGVLYAVRQASYQFTETATAPNWNRQANNTKILIATGTYVQFQVDSSSVTSSTAAARVHRVALNWQEGSDKPVASGFLDHRYFLCAQFSETDANNSACLILQKNNKWTKWTGAAPYSMGLFNNQLIVGDASSNSYVWKIMQDGVYQDDGVAIDAYWTSKHFSLGRPFQQKILHEMWTDAVYESSSTLSVGYATDRGTAFTSRTVNLDTVANISNKRIPLTAGYALGKYLQFKFSNSTIDNYFKLNNYLFYTETKDRIPEAP